MHIGTSYFRSKRAAVRYYSYENWNIEVVEQSVYRKIKSGEIHIGKPPLKPGQSLELIDGGNRYAIVD